MKIKQRIHLSAWILSILLFLSSYSISFSQRVLDEFKPVFGRAPWLSHIAKQSDGKILVGGISVKIADDQIINQFARINTDGSVDETFQVNDFRDDNLSALTVLDNGDILYGLQDQGIIVQNFETGELTELDIDISIVYGVTKYDGNLLISGISSEGYPLKLYDYEGNQVESFTPGFADFLVSRVAVMDDGKIIATGLFSEYNGVDAGQVVKLNSDGTIDDSFNVGSGSSSQLKEIMPGANNKLFVGGSFDTFNGTTAPGGFLKLDVDGSPEDGFILGPVGNVLSFTTVIHELENGKILVGGFSVSSNTSSLLRLNADGSIDNTFDILTIDGGPGTREMQIIEGDDDNIYIVGNFSDNIEDVSVQGLAVLDDSGNLLSGYPQFGQTSYINDAVIQGDGKYLVRGDFVTANGLPYDGYARLNADGTIDETFDQLNIQINSVSGFANQADGKVIIAGSFIVDSQDKSAIRLNVDGTLDDSFGIDFRGVPRDIVLMDDNIFLTFNSGLNIYKYDLNGVEDDTYDGIIDLPGTYRHDRLFADQNGALLSAGGIDNSGSGGTVYRIDSDGVLDETFSMEVTPQVMITIKRLSDEQLVMGGSFVTSFGTSDPNPLYFVDNIGNIVDQSSIAITGDGVTGKDQRYHDIIPFNDGLLILGSYKEINGVESEGISLVATNGLVDSNIDFDLDGTAEVGILDDTNEIMTFFGGFGEINGELRLSAARIQLTNYIPIINGAEGLSTDEEVDLILTKEDLDVTDLDDDYPEDFVLEVIEGENYSVAGNTLTPITDFNGTLNVTVTVFDGQDESEAVQVPVEVLPVNDVPVLVAATREFNVLEDNELELLISDFEITDPDNSQEDFSFLFTAGDNYIIEGNTVIPSQDFFGEITVPVKVTDGEDESNVLEITIVVDPVNDVPVISGTIDPIATDEDVAIEISVDQLEISDPDNDFPEDFSITLTVGENYSLNENEVIPSSNYFGTLTVPITVNDGMDESESFDLEVQVNSVNDVPEITDFTSSYEILEDESVTLNLSDFQVNDPDHTYPDDFSFAIEVNELFTVEDNVITPLEDLDVNFVIPVVISDGEGVSAPYNVTVVVTPINDRPVILGTESPLEIVSLESLELTINDLIIDDPDNDFPDDFDLTVLGGNNYSLSGSTITPEESFLGTLQVGVQVNDGELSSETAILDIEVVEPLNVTAVDDVKVYPNPTAEVLIIKSDNGKPIKNIKLFDLVGREMSVESKKLDPRSYQVNLNGIATGTYVLKFDAGQETSVIRISVKN